MSSHPAAPSLTSSAHTLSSCASMVQTHSEPRTAQSLSRPSEPAETSCVPRLTKCSLSTDEVWPSSVRRQVKLLTDHTLSVMSPLPLAITLSTGEKATDQTARLCPLSAAASVSPPPSAAMVHTLTRRSCPPVTAMRSLGARPTALMSLACPMAVPVARGCSGAASAAAPPEDASWA